MSKLYLVPTPIGNLEDITFRAIRILKEVDYILAEDTRTSGKLLKHFEIATPMQSHHMHNEHKTVDNIVRRLQSGETFALISDAGTPAISDPGFLLTRACVQNDIDIECLPGATAFVPALVNSGLPNDKFVFEGFLPVKKGRQTRLKLLAQEPRTIIFYESPHKLLKTLTHFKEYFGEDRQVSVSREAVKEIIKETSDTVSIIFDIPSNLQNNFSFVSGQYITLKTEINGEQIRRAYSLCSSPKSGTVQVAVKTVENGVFSTYANQTLKAGDTLEVGEPEGKFTLEAENNKNYIGFVAGSGITPVLSMVKSVLESDTNATFTLVYGNKSPETTIFYKEINALVEANPTQLSVNYIYSREKIEGSLSGRIDASQVNFFSKNKNFDKAFLCGPEEMINIVSETLANNGFTKENILFELFTASTTTEEVITEGNDGETEVIVVLDDEGQTLY